MANTRVGRLIAAALILVGAILLIVALLTPWYSLQTSASGASETINFYPGLPGSNGTIQYSCSGGVHCPSQTSYSNLPANNTGMLAEAGFFILIVGGILGIVAAALGIASAGRPKWGTPVVALAVVALLLAIIAPSLYAAALPSAASKDSPGHSGLGPWSSFMGTNSSTRDGFTLTMTWGPAIGWYLSFAAFVVLVAGAVLFVRWRRDVASTSTASPGASSTGGLPPAPPAP